MTKPLIRYVIDVEKVQRVRIEVTARSQAEAEQRAIDDADDKYMTTTHKTAVVASWPYSEPATLVSDLGRGYFARRGWFYVVATSGGRFGHGSRTVSFPADVIEEKGVARETFDAYFVPPERAWTFTRVYGFACTHESVQTWSRVFPEVEPAFKATRKFIEESRQFDRDRQRADHARAEAIRQERAMDKVLLRMLRDYDHRLTRMHGGRWVTSDLADKPDVVPEVFEDKAMIEALIEADYVNVVDTMNKSGDPRVVQLSDDGYNRAVLADAIPVALQV